MAIQMRRGAYKNFDPLKMLPAEWAIVMSGDPVVSDGKSAWICFTAGVVKRMATYEDMVQIFGDMTEDAIRLIEERVDAQLILAKDATQYANNAGKSAYEQSQNAERAANHAMNVADDLETRRDAGEFIGPQGPQGLTGKDGADGVVSTFEGQFGFQVEKGHLMLYYPDGETPPDFSIQLDGHLVLDIAE